MTNWIKQIGLSPVPLRIPSTEECDYIRTVDFADSPERIKIGDQLFIYAVGHQYLYARLEVLSIPFKGHPEEFATGARNPDYPWLLLCRNMDKKFSDEWFDHKLNLLETARLFHDQKGGLVTLPGAANLNGLMAGNSFIGLQEGFVQYLLQKMAACEIR